MPFDQNNLPEWKAPGVEPPQSKKDSGWGPSEKPPADWFNWFFNKTYNALRSLFTNAQHKEEKGQPNGYAALDANGKVINADGTYPGGVQSVNGRTGTVNLTASDVGASPTGHTHAFADITGKPNTLAGYGITDAIPASQKGVANGVASLDGNTKVPTAQLPSASTTAQGIVQLVDSVTSTSTTQAATANAVKQVNDAVVAHSADYVKHPGYGVATGPANAYGVTLNPAPTSYVEGMAVSVKINVDNTGPSTININGLGAKAIKKPNGNDVSAGNLKAGSIYTLRYNGTNFILQGEGGSGNAQPSDVLSGKTFTNDSGEQVGTMLARTSGRWSSTWTNPDGDTVVDAPIPASGFYGTGASLTIQDPDLIPANIKNGVSIFGVTGTLQQASGGLLGGSTNVAQLSAGRMLTGKQDYRGGDDYQDRRGNDDGGYTIVSGSGTNKTVTISKYDVNGTLLSTINITLPGSGYTRNITCISKNYFCVVDTNNVHYKYDYNGNLLATIYAVYTGGGSIVLVWLGLITLANGTNAYVVFANYSGTIVLEVFDSNNTRLQTNLTVWNYAPYYNGIRRLSSYHWLTLSGSYVGLLTNDGLDGSFGLTHIVNSGDVNNRIFITKLFSFIGAIGERG